MAGPDSSYLLYKNNSCIFQIFYECELFDKIEKTHFLPWWQPKSLAKSGYGYEKVNSHCKSKVFFISFLLIYLTFSAGYRRGFFLSGTICTATEFIKTMRSR